MKHLILLLISTLPAASAPGQEMNGFDLSNAAIPARDILSGGPPRDGIPAIDEPQFIRPTEVEFLRDDDIVISLTHASITRAYPLRILIWHEIVNEVIGTRPVAVTYCPLCGTAMVFDRTISGKVRRLGVSGLLYQSDVLMYDRESNSLWSQLMMKGVSGPGKGTRLTLLPSEHMTWSAWRERYPQGQVLSTDTGHSRDYRATAYSSYFATEQTMFPVPQTRRELRNKEWIVGIILGGTAKAYPLEQLPSNPVKDRIGKHEITVRHDAAARRPVVLDAAGDPVPHVVAFWFAWQAFYPQTELWKP